MIEIRHRVSGAVLYRTENAQDVRAALTEAARGRAYLRGAYLGDAYLGGADLRGANLRGANLRGANLRGADLRDADLRGADLRDADLRGANLRGADLRDADLRDADLRDAYLRGALGVNPLLVSPLHMLSDQPGPIRAYKLVNADGEGPFNGGLHYEVGGLVEVSDASTDPNVACAAGINVASLDWCLREWRVGYRILVVEFTAADIACIPTATDGKFRLFRCRVVGEKDLVAVGCIPEEGRDE